MKLYNLNITFRLGNDIHHITVSAPGTDEEYAYSEILTYMQAHELTGSPQIISIIVIERN